MCSPLVKQPALGTDSALLVCLEQLHSNVALQLEVDHMCPVSLSVSLGECVCFESVECSLLETHLTELVRVEDSVDLAFNLGEDKLVLGHHVEGLCLQHLLLLVHHDTLLACGASLVLLIELDLILAHLIVVLFQLHDVLAQLTVRHLV